MEYKYTKQSGGHGQYGHVKMTFVSLREMLEEAYEFAQDCSWRSAVPKNFFPAVEKGLQEGVLKGPLAGISGSGRQGRAYTTVPITRLTPRKWHLRLLQEKP